MLFDDPQRPLRDVLLHDFLIPTAKWLLGSPLQAYLLPQAANSNWESALSMWFLAELIHELPPSDQLVGQVAQKVPQTARWIVSQAHEDGDFAHWEGVTWDTAVCIRAVHRALLDFEASFSESERRHIRDMCIRATRWLIREFRTWDTEVIYPFGPADVAQILVTLLYLRSTAPEQLREALQSAGDPSDLGVIEQIARYLIAAKEDMPLSAASTDVVAFWGDFFQSGEVIECLATYVSDCQARHEDEDWALECRDHIVSCVRYMETAQLDGKWGTHSDTCRALYAYLKASNILGDVGQEHHVVLKALRWMCDPKQTFSDGSFMHTTFITVFYALAILAAYSEWSLANLPVIRVYDLALWSAPVRSTPERGLRLKLQVEAAHLRREYEAARDGLKSFRRLCAGVGAFLGVVASAFVVAVSSGVVRLDASVPDKNALLGLAAVTAVVAVAAGGVLFRGRG